ncbi:sugar transferase [Altererythrobacter sp. C41]|uniref:sugar transferase n=1 Tax=Altererythrobacter sp. C41 TaxID=2806021 RepID=UPI0019323BEE|nr:sugar transferase [Altererythrobacter sp. C41]MBM0171290.1 sugar transferase [Altererythrobacter sp. C41]
MSLIQAALKRTIDVSAATIGLICLSPVIVIAIILARRDTGSSGLFRQRRIGRGGEPFTVLKIRTMRAITGTTITSGKDARITPLGAQLRRWKIDELPQLWNVLKGEMSLVGPRPDVPGYADRLTGDDRVILKLRPGITGPATLKYREEEALLATQADPQAYNDEVIWPDKVTINRRYYLNYRLRDDFRYIWRTLTGY